MNAHTPAPGNIAALPPALAGMAAQPRWLVWKWEKNDKGRLTKVPYRAANPSVKASSTDPKTWGSYEAARDAALAGQADGIGFALLDANVAAFDLDDCIAEDGSILTWAWNLVDTCGSYVERTVSGNGLRILGIATGEKIHRKQKVPGTPSSLETYRRAERYIVISGAALDGFGGELRAIDAHMDEWVDKLDADAKAERERERVARSEAKAKPQGALLNAFEAHAGHSDRTGLPRELDDLVRYGVKDGRRSDKFMHAVGWLKDLGHSPAHIEAILGAHPSGIAEKFVDRLRAEVDRCYDKAETKHRPAGSTARETPRESKADQPKVSTLIWFGDKPPEPPPMLVRDLIPQDQIVIMAGVYSSGKTFVAGDLAVSVMLAVPFAGREIMRPGGVLWLAAEGANEIDARIKAAAEARSDGEAHTLPFARQAFDVPKLTGPDAEAQLIAHADAFKAGLAQRFPGTDLVMIVIDTLGSAAGFVDGNSPAEAQRVMDMLRRVNTRTGSLVVLVDHFGKVVETGVMGASSKAQSAEAILAILADKSMDGTISNRRMVLHKFRSGAGGVEVPFKLRQVPLGGFDGTTCVVDWTDPNAAPATILSKTTKSPWSGAADKILKGCIERMLIDHGSEQQPFGIKGPRVKAVHLDKVRTEFISNYPGETPDAKRKAFKRALEAAILKSLVATKEIGASLTDWIWFAVDIPDA